MVEADAKQGVDDDGVLVDRFLDLVQDLFIRDVDQRVFRGDPLQECAFRLYIVAGASFDGDREYRDGEAREQEVARCDEAVASVAARSTQNDEVRPQSLFCVLVRDVQCHVRDSLAGALHKHDRRHAVFVEGVFLDTADLTTSRRSHTYSRILPGSPWPVSYTHLRAHE